MRRLYKLSELKKLSNVTDLGIIRGLSTGHQQVINELSPFIPGITIRYECFHNQDGKVYINCSQVFFERNGMSFYAHHLDNTGYHIHAHTDHLPNISRYDKDKAMNGLDKPTRMHKVSQKKVNDVIDFQAEYYRRLKDISDLNTLNIELLLKKIRSVPEARIDQDQKGGEIVRNGLRFSFNINAGYIETKIEVKLGWEEKTFENFMYMSDNKLTGK